MNAEIIAVGSELLTPTRVDTNSLVITERLNEIGIALQGKSVAGDDPAMLKAIAAQALARADLVILTGGLGPTDDDLTRNVVADLLAMPLEFHADVFAGIEKRFAARGLRVPEINRRQAMAPRGAVILENRFGTAPGLWIERDGKVVILLPGPPGEMRPMLEAVIRDRLGKLAGASRMFRRILRVAGRTESHVEEAMQPLYGRWLAARLPIAATILASPGQIELHLTVSGTDVKALQAALDAAVEDTQAVLGLDLFSGDGEEMPQVVGALLRARGLRIAVAESCTGGLVMSRLTDVPGSSDYLDRGVVVYSNKSKIDLLGVPESLLEAHGAVSEAVAEAMAVGMVQTAGASLGLGITGIAGPSGGTPAKPVGTVAIAAAWVRGGKTDTRVRLFNFLGGRELIKFQASQAALDMVRRWILEEATV